MPSAWAPTGGWPRRWPWPAAWPRSSAGRGPWPASRRAWPCPRAAARREPARRRGRPRRRGADAVLVLLALREALGLHLGRDDEAGLAPAAQRGVDGGHDHVDVGDAAVGGPRLGAVEDPLVLGLVVGGPGLQRRHVGAGVGLGHAERPSCTFSAVPKHCGTHSMTCSGVPAMPAAASPAEDGEADAGVAPEQLFEGDRERQPVSSPSEAGRRSRRSRGRSSPPPRAARGTPRARPTPPQPAARPTRRSRGPTS